ncbi:MAG: fibronectin type III domain-containing protein [Treponema sp.]|nr:fibronectin type III domain-containing protein [Treponema sp.]
MKSTFKVFGHAILAVIIGFSIISCNLFDDEDGNNDNDNDNSELISAPNTPTNVITYRISPTSVFITWNSVPTATSYSVQRSACGSTWSDSGITSSRNYTDVGWITSDTGYIRVAAVNSGGISSYSSDIFFPAFTPGTTITYGEYSDGFHIVGAINTIISHPVTLPTGITYIEWADKDNVSLDNYTNIEVGLVRGSTGLFVYDFVNTTFPAANRFTYVVLSGRQGDYYVVVRKRLIADATLYDLRVWS